MRSPRWSRNPMVWTTVAMVLVGLGVLVGIGMGTLGKAQAQAVEPPEAPTRALASLKGVKPPLPDLTGIVRDKNFAIALGKALFWDQQVGSDQLGQACASCHFHAGADSRIVHQLTPGLIDGRDVDQNGVAGDQRFGGLVSGVVNPNNQSPAGTAGKTASGNVADSNITLVPGDFPLHQLTDPLDRNSNIRYTTNDVVSSQGTFDGGFVSIDLRNPTEKCGPADATVFHAGPFAARKVEPRQTPTTINSVFNFRNFWDGRANNNFNGNDPFGRRNVNATVLVKQPNGTLQPISVAAALNNASLASQADGPPLSDFEMSCANKTFAHLGRKMLTLRPLALQTVHAGDSVLGPHRHPSGKGLKFTYSQLIKAAFDAKFTTGTGTVGGFTQLEQNFSFFWGIAIMLYESTLVSDDSPFDRFMGCPEPQCTPAIPPNPAALTPQQQAGLAIFTGKGRCVNCHDGPEFSKAATHLQPEAQEEGLVERMIHGDGGVVLYDNGFYNIGVRPTVEDRGVGGKDPFGNPLSFTRQYLDILRGKNVPDPFQIDPCTFEVRFSAEEFKPGAVRTVDCRDGTSTVEPTDPEDINKLRVAVDGAFKTAILRNIGLTPPYFHNGGQATLAQVVAFYNRGGDRRGQDGDDTTGSGPLGKGGETGSFPEFSPRGSNLDPDIQRLELTAEEQAALVAFLLSLTDDRVACEKPPFDHPEITVANDGRQDEDANWLAGSDILGALVRHTGSRRPRLQHLRVLGVFQLARYQGRNLRVRSADPVRSR